MNDQAKPARPPKRGVQRPRRAPETTTDSLNPQTLADIKAAFRGCARCSYLLAGYQALYSQARLDDILSHNRRNWIHLEWHSLDELLRRLDDYYGYQVLVPPLHFEGLCSECRRAFAYHDAEALNASAETPDVPLPLPSQAAFTLRLQILPRPRL